ncbi:DUF1738 domain-containing protein [bacterium]|nr:DUF1738 domain-containing protein [bacterium]
MAAKKVKKNVYQIVTERVIEKMEAGVIPWRKPWGGLGPAKNLVSKKPYRGINTFLLGSAGHISNYWLTFNQVKDKGGTIKKGAQSEMVVFWKKLDAKEDPDTAEEGNAGESLGSRAILRYYRVFNLDDVEGIVAPEELKPLDFEPHEKAEAIVDGYRGKPVIKADSKAAYYPAPDVVGMPPEKFFHSVEEYYSTLFHELVHSTGHKRRLGRDGFNAGDSVMFGSSSYSKEELIAEMGNAFLCAESGIEGTFDNSVAYIQSWVKKFKDHPKMVVQAAGAAQMAADHILGRISEE